MGSPYLNSDEFIILSTHNILIDAAVSEVILTNRRLLIVDSGNVRFQHKEMSFAAIETVTTMESGSGDPAISLAVFTKSGGTNPMQLVFTQQPRSQRTSERDEWAQKIKEQVYLLPDGTAPEYVDFAEDEAEDLKKLIESGGAPAEAEDKNPPASTGPKSKTSLSSRHTPASASPGKKMLIATTAIIVIILLIACAAFIYPAFMSPKTGVTLPAVTPAPTTAATIEPATTAVITAEPTPVSAITPVQTPGSQPAAVNTSQPRTDIPGNGVWVRIGYDGEYIGTIGAGGRLREVSGTSGRFYQIPAASTDIVEISIQKLDTTGLPLTVELFNNGKMIKDKTIITPKGTLTMTVDLKTIQTPIVTPAVTL
ncbi:MAG: hypothetical protein Q7V05_01585 [Methanoregula sp.]|nr:hypothetical protein [Methanoregula sp.]